MFGRASATNLIKNFNTGLSSFDFFKLVQGKFFIFLQTERKEINLNKLLNLGNWNLLVVHATLRTAIEDTE